MRPGENGENLMINTIDDREARFIDMLENSFNISESDLF